MKPRTLALASLAVAAATCLATLAVLRPREVSDPAAALTPIPTLEVAPPDTAPPAEPRPDAAPAPPRDEAERLAERARAAEAQEQALRDAILRIGEGEDLPLDARLERYREALAAARAQAPDAAFFAYPSMLAELFLRMPEVQRELAAMSPAQRAAALAHVRRELGFDEAGIARMAEIDERREARWQTGLAYMRERARATATFEGEALEAELEALREEYFGDEAPTIAAEERDGFFRFERPRVYGRN